MRAPWQGRPLGPKIMEISTEKADMVLRMLSCGMSLEEVADISRLPVAKVLELASPPGHKSMEACSRTTLGSPPDSPRDEMAQDDSPVEQSEEEQRSRRARLADLRRTRSRDLSEQSEEEQADRDEQYSEEGSTFREPTLRQHLQGQRRQQEQAQQLLHSPAEKSEEKSQDLITVYLDRIRAHIFRRRARSRDFFRDFDSLHCGRVTRADFSRALSNIVYPNLFYDMETPVDPDALCDAYTDSGERVIKPRVVNYIRFCNDIDQAFGFIPDLEKQPQVYVPSPGEYVLDAGGFKPRICSDEERCWALMKRMAILMASRAIDLGTCFNDCQRAPVDIASGRIEPELFVKKLPLCQSTSTREAAFQPHEMDLLLEKYTDDNGFLRLFFLERDMQTLVEGIDPLAEKPIISPVDQRVMTPRPPSFNKSTIGFSMQKPLHLQQRPKSACQARSPRDFNSSDFSISGSATARQQRPSSAHPASRAPAGGEPPRLSAGAAPAGGEPPRQRPQSARPSGQRSSGRAPGPPRQSVMVKLTRKAYERRLRLRDIFRDADKFRRGVITRSQMGTALAVLGITLSAEELEELFGRYGFADSSGSTSFQYLVCCADLEESVQQE
ncbi:unnamed protein product, partial [Polarella glacialis]